MQHRSSRMPCARFRHRHRRPPSSTCSPKAADASPAPSRLKKARAAAGADVTLVQLSRHTTADSTGTFQFDAVPAGKYLIEVVSPRYGSAVGQVLVKDGEEATVTLSIDLTVHHEDVVVSAGVSPQSVADVAQSVVGARRARAGAEDRADHRRDARAGAGRPADAVRPGREPADHPRAGRRPDSHPPGRHRRRRRVERQHRPRRQHRPLRRRPHRGRPRRRDPPLRQQRRGRRRQRPRSPHSRSPHRPRGRAET